MTTNTPILQASAIALAYPDAHGPMRCVLRDFSLDVAASETVVLLGPSGAGKSSLLRVLAGLQQPHSGSLKLFSQPVRAPHPRAAFVFQQAALLPWLNVRRNVAFGLDFRHQPRLDKAEQQARVDAAIAEVGLSHAAHYRPSQLSGGMAQRVALARALARAPQLLLLDEPFGALDAMTRSDMQHLLHQVTTHHRTATVLVTHDIDEALLLAKRIVLIGRTPARVIGQWHLPQPFSQRQNANTLRTLRADILAALDDARQHSTQNQTVDFVI